MWRAVFTGWHRRTLPDLSQFYGIDADSVLEERSWRWLRGHIIALLDIPDSRINRFFDK